MSLPEQNDILFALKALHLMRNLTDATKSVGAAIIDHFNKKNGQCDPGVDRLATLLGMSRATVLRATETLHERGLIEKDSHGGKFRRASYSPNWARFREFVEDWDARMKVGAAYEQTVENAKPAEPKVSRVRPSRSQGCDVNGRTDATQTHRSNQSNKPIEREQAETAKVNSCPPAVQKPQQRLSKRNKRQTQTHLFLPLPGGKRPSQGEVARDAAQRRWEQDVKAHGEHVYAAVTEWMTPQRMHDATEAEMKRKGAGLKYIHASMHREGMRANG